uniref:Uncharacterized protein n=1 Tax=Arundo donax TaxID=35708 RepID=A0A0A9HND4_ARUDO
MMEDREADICPVTSLPESSTACWSPGRASSASPGQGRQGRRQRSWEAAISAALYLHVTSPGHTWNPP